MYGVGGSSPAVAHGVICVASYDLGNVHPLSANSGTVLWTGTTGGHVGFTSPAVVDGLVYIIGPNDGIVHAYALDPLLESATASTLKGVARASAPNPAKLVPGYGLKPQREGHAGSARDVVRAP